MQTKGKMVQFEGKDMKLEGKILGKEFKLTRTQVKECYKKKVVRKTDSKITVKRKCKMKYIKKYNKCNIWLEIWHANKKAI